MHWHASRVAPCMNRSDPASLCSCNSTVSLQCTAVPCMEWLRCCLGWCAGYSADSGRCFAGLLQSARHPCHHCVCRQYVQGVVCEERGVHADPDRTHGRGVCLRAELRRQHDSDWRQGQQVPCLEGVVPAQPSGRKLCAVPSPVLTLMRCHALRVHVSDHSLLVSLTNNRAGGRGGLRQRLTTARCTGPTPGTLHSALCTSSMKKRGAKRALRVLQALRFECLESCANAV
jgi:hypothetical protein